MSRIWQTGFEWNTTTIFSSTYGTIATSSTRARTGAYSLLPNAGRHWGNVTFAANKTEVYGRVCINIDAFHADVRRCGFLAITDDIGTVHLTLRVNPGSGLIELMLGSSAGTVIAIGIAPIPLDTWTAIFFRCVIDDAPNGIFTLRINSSTAANDIAFTGDTRNAGNANIRTVRVGNQSDNATTGMTCYHDDVAFNDTVGAVNNSWLADGGVYGLSPTGAAALGHTDWTPSAGANWQCVDEKPPTEDTDYVSTSTVGHKDTYVMGDTPGAGVIAALAYWLRARKEGAGDTVNTRRLFHIGAAEHVGAAHVLGTSYTNAMEILETSPATAVAWDYAEVDAMEAGQECV